MKRLRKKLAKEKYPHKIKYYTVGEYGGITNRPHYHSIIFNLPQFYQDNPHRLQELWTHGHVQVDQVTGASIAYVCGYVNKQTFFHNFGPQDDRIPEFNFMSKGLGANYLTEAMTRHLKETLNPYLVIEDGQKISMPKYFKEKAFTEEEKQILADLAKQHLEKNPTFADDTAKREYVKREATLRLRDIYRKKRKL